MNHIHHHTSRLEIGITYQCILNNIALYTASIEKIEGCQATVQVKQVLPSPHAHHYKEGQKFNIKVGMYRFIEQ